MEFLEKRPFAIVCPSERKDDFLRLRGRDPGLDFSLYTKEEVLSLFGLQKDLRSVAFLIRKGFPYPLALDLLEAFCAPFFERTTSSKLLPLVKIRAELLEKGLLWRYPNVERMFADKHVLLCDYGEASSLSECLSSCSNKMMIDFALRERKGAPSFYLSFKNVYEELHYVFNEIAHDIDSGLSPSDIFLYGATEEHYRYMEDLSSLYGLAIDLPSSHRLFDHPSYRLFREQCLCGTFELALSIAKEEYPNIDFLPFASEASFFDREFEKVDEVLPIFDEIARKTLLPSPKRKHAIRLLKEPIAKKGSKIYAIHFAMGSYPCVHKERGYLTDSERNEIGLLGGAQRSIDESSFLSGMLESGNVALLSYEERAFGSTFFPSGLASTYGMERRKALFEPYEYSKKKGEFLLSMLLDKKENFDEDDERIAPLKEVASPSFRTYDYRVKGPIDVRMNGPITFSQGSFETYLFCPFKYLYDSVLRLSDDPSSLAIDLGTLFHKVLELHYDDPSKDHDALYEEATKNFGSIDEKEAFFFEHLKPYSKKNLEFYEELDSYFPGLEVSSEGSFDVAIGEGVRIRGRFDRIGTFESGEKYLYIIDYKSGTKRFDPILFENYSLNPQLPFYACFAKKDPKFAPYKIAGLFISPLLKMEIRENHKDEYTKKDRNAMKLAGIYLDDVSLWKGIGTFGKEGYSDFFSGMRMTKKNGLSGNACSFSEEKMDELCESLSASLEESAKKIREGRFEIAPLFIQRSSDPCQDCAYRGICYRKKRDFPLLTKEKEVGFETDEEEEETDGMDD